MLQIQLQKKTLKDADKVGVAVRICEETARLNILDLELRLDELTQMVQRANDLGLKRLA